MQWNNDPEQLFQFLAVINSQIRLERLMPQVLDFTLALTGAERAFLLVYDSHKELSLKAARYSTGEDASEDDFQGSTSIIHKVVKEQQPVYVPDFQLWEQFAKSESVRKWNLESAVCLPLILNVEKKMEPVGVLYVDSSSSGTHLTENHLQLLQALASFMAISIANAKLFAEVEKQQKEISALNAQLQRRVEVQAGNLEEMKLLLAETQRELGKVYGLGNIIGKSPPMLKIFKILEKIVTTHATVLIQGDSGTGKEMVAKYIHYNGPRKEKPLVSINCSAFSETLLESELFGHSKGSFTGATQDKMGLFQLADGGTLFLDELGDMSLEMQKKLLRVLQDGEVRPVGGKEPKRVDVRIVAATNRNLKKLIEEGKFREDLFFRLNVIRIEIPALKERPEDIPLLIDFFTHKISQELQRPLKPPDPKIIQEYMEYDWPGNVRELENELRRLFILGSEYEPEYLQQMKKEQGEENYGDFEKSAILKALDSAHGNKSKAAELLGMPRRTFYRKLIKYNIY